MDDDVSLDSIQDSEDDILEPDQANNKEDSLYSGGDRDDDQLTENLDDEDRQPGIAPNNE